MPSSGSPAAESRLTEDRLRAQTRDAQIRFLGSVAAREFYPKVDVVIVPSLLNEALGMVVMEAFAFGKPVIGSRRGGIPEMIRHRENGLLVDPDLPDELLTALSEVHADSQLRAALAANARTSSAPFLDMSAWIKTYEDLYREVINTNPAASPKQSM